MIGVLGRNGDPGGGGYNGVAGWNGGSIGDGDRLDLFPYTKTPHFSHFIHFVSTSSLVDQSEPQSISNRDASITNP